MNTKSLEFRALTKTVGFCAITSIVVLVLSFALSFLSLQAVLWAFLITLFVFGFYMMYSVNLNNLQMKELGSDSEQIDK